MATKKFKFTDLSDDITFEQKPLEKEDSQKDLSKENDFIKNTSDNIKKVPKKQKNSIDNSVSSNTTIIEKKESQDIISSVSEIENDTDTVEIDPYINLETENLSNYVNQYTSHTNIDENKNIQIENKSNHENFVYKSNGITKTFQESISNFSDSNLESEKELDINNLIDHKERLSVKTNIYLKPNLVSTIKKLCDETNNSRSAIINKLIEIGIKSLRK